MATDDLCEGNTCPCVSSAFGACTTAGTRRVDAVNCACRTSAAAISSLQVCQGFEFACVGCNLAYQTVLQDRTVCPNAPIPTGPTPGSSTVPPVPDPRSPNGPNPLSTGAIVGVAFGATAAAVAVAAVGSFVWKSLYLVKVKGAVKGSKAAPPSEQEKTAVQTQGEANAPPDGEQESPHHPVHPPFSRLLRTILRRKDPEEDAEGQQAPPPQST